VVVVSSKGLLICYTAPLFVATKLTQSVVAKQRRFSIEQADLCITN
jgi:hypothetical protein